MKRDSRRILISFVFFCVAFAAKFLSLDLSAALFLISYLIAGWDVLYRAARNIRRADVFNENFLMSVASIGALLIGEYPESAAVMLFYQVGEAFQNRAVAKSKKSIAELMDIRPDFANVKRGGDIVKTDPSIVRVGEEIIVRAGERIPLDGVVTDGKSTLDTSALTGEPTPKAVYPGKEVMSGCISTDGVITIRVTREYRESTVNRILDLVENASVKKSARERFITKFARYYTPCVVIVAALLAFVPVLLFQGELSVWLRRALVFLVVSCPCALVISVPLSFFGGIGGASRGGILIKGGNDIEALSKIETVVFDKTGTLTEGVFRVREIKPRGISEDELLRRAAIAEAFSNHPIARSIVAAYGGDIDKTRISGAEEIAGEGVVVRYGGSQIAAGNQKLMERHSISCPAIDTPGTAVYIAKDSVCLGYLIIADELKKDAQQSVLRLKRIGVKHIAMLTGDSEGAAAFFAQKLRLDEYHAELLPQGKVAHIERMSGNKTAGGTLAFVGDGVNDAPVLARSDIGIAMGAFGSDAAIEAADVVIMTDEPSKVAQAIGIAKRTLSIANQNIVLALTIKFGVLILGAFGLAGMWAAVLADVGVSVAAILNAMRALKVTEKSK